MQQLLCHMMYNNWKVSRQISRADSVSTEKLEQHSIILYSH